MKILKKKDIEELDKWDLEHNEWMTSALGEELYKSGYLDPEYVFKIFKSQELQIKKLIEKVQELEGRIERVDSGF